jgi:hypothetical protein
MSKVQAIDLVRSCAAEHIPPADQERFVEVTETQLMSLHHGNMARYRLRPSEFQAWQASWK